MNDLGILKDGVFTREIDESMIQDDEMKRSYLRGPLAGGSVNNPETSSYHLEIFHYMKIIQKA